MRHVLLSHVDLLLILTLLIIQGLTVRLTHVLHLSDVLLYGLEVLTRLGALLVREVVQSTDVGETLIRHLHQQLVLVHLLLQQDLGVLDLGLQGVQGLGLLELRFYELLVPLLLRL